MHDDAPADDDDPFEHFLHFDDPVLSAYVPTGHDVQADPAVEQYVPFAQGVHDDAPADDDDPIGQTAHVDDPALHEYVPGAHDVHTDPAVEE